MNKKEKFADLIYWKATRWILLFYFITVIIVSIMKCYSLMIIISIIATSHYIWMIRYEKNYKKNLDNFPKIQYNNYRKKKGSKQMKILNKIICVISILFLLWVILSYFDIILHNLNEEPVYKFWNFFQLLVENPL